MEKLYKDKDWLYDKYWNEKLSRQQIADLCGCSAGSIQQSMNKFGIKARSLSDARSLKFKRDKPYHNKMWLYSKYWDEELSIKEIAKLCKCSYRKIQYWIYKFNIETRDFNETYLLESKKKKRLYCNKDWLYQKYYEEELSRQQIANLCGCTYIAIQYWMNKFDIKPRDISERSLLREKKDPISITNEMKEFIIGDTLGDGSLINVRAKNVTTSAYSHSSKYEKMAIYISNKMDSFGFKRSGRIREYVHKKFNATYFSYWSRYYRELKYFKDILYRDNKKIIPRNIELTSTIIKHWYIGDGSISNKGKNLRICSQGFSIDDVNYAIGEFNKLGIICHRLPSDNSIQVSRKDSIKKFFEYIGDCPKEIEDIYGYKFKKEMINGLYRF